MRSSSRVTLSPYQKTNPAERRSDPRPGHSDRVSKAKAVTTQRTSKMTCASAPACAAHPPATQGERGAAAHPPARVKTVSGSAGPPDSVPECGAPQVYPRRQTASTLIPVRIKKSRLKLLDPEKMKILSCDTHPPVPGKGNTQMYLLTHGRTSSKQTPLIGRRSAPSRPADTKPHPGVAAVRWREASPARRMQVGAYNHQKTDMGINYVIRQIDTLVLMDKTSSDASSESKKEPSIASSIQPLPESVKDSGTAPLDDNYVSREAPENVRSKHTPRDDNEESVSGPSGASDISSKLKTEPCACSFEESHKDIDRSRDQRGTCSFSLKEIQGSTTSSLREVRAADAPPLKEIPDVSDLSFTELPDVSTPFREDADGETRGNGQDKTLKPNAEQQNISVEKAGHQNRDGLQTRAQRTGENGQRRESGEDEERKAEGTAYRFPREGGIFQTSVTRVHNNSNEMMPEGDVTGKNIGGTPKCIEPGEISINSAIRNDPCPDITAGGCHDVVPDIDRGAAGRAGGEVRQTKPVVDQIKDGDPAWTSAIQDEVVRRSRGILILRSTEENAIFIPKLKFEFTPDNSIDCAAFTHQTTGLQEKGERKWSDALDARPRSPHGPVVSKSILKRASLNHSPAGSGLLGQVPLSRRVGGGSHGHPDEKPPLYGIVDLSLSFRDNISAQAIPAGIPKILIPDEDDDS